METAVVKTKSILMDRRIHMEATRGDVGEFSRILQTIYSEKEMEKEEGKEKEKGKDEELPQQTIWSKILREISPGVNTCLHIAVKFGHQELAKYIVEQCPDLVKEANLNGDTPLHIAARRRDLSFVKFAMESFSSGSSSGTSRDVEKSEDSSILLRILNNEENTVLHEALISRCQEKDVVEIILNKADPGKAYFPNKEGKSPLYLAAQANYFHAVDAIAKFKVENQVGRQAIPALHGAILRKNIEMLEKLMGMKLEEHQRDKEGRTPLHYAAWTGYLEGVQKLLMDQSNHDGYMWDNNGFCPIHVASKRGYVDIVKEFMQVSSDSMELLTNDGGNFLHVAAKFDADNIVNFVLKEKRLENLINDKDRYGNTPLHLATTFGHPKVIQYLTWDKRVDLNLANDQGQTAFDIAVSVERPSFHQTLTWTVLKSAGAQPVLESTPQLLGPSGYADDQEPPIYIARFPVSDFAPARPIRHTRNLKIPPEPSDQSPNMDAYKDRVNTLLLVSTLVVTVTFAAGFTMPGGYNSSDSNSGAGTGTSIGMATLLMRNMFDLFVICNTLAMYTSILAAITLIWAQLGDFNLMDTALRFAVPFLGLSLTTMSLGFMAGVYLVVSHLHWLGFLVISIAIICLLNLSASFLLLFLPSKSTNRILRYISYYPFLIFIWASKNPKIKREG